jgi:hypothetical protein
MSGKKKVMVDEMLDCQQNTPFRKHNLPTIDEVKALAGKVFTMLTERENLVLDFYRQQGRKFGVSIRIESEADPDLLRQAKCEQQADEIMKRSNSRIYVAVQ